MTFLTALTGKRELTKLWTDIQDAFSVPIVYHPGGWEDTLPAKLRKEVLRQRLAKVLNGGWEVATNAEATCYLSTASFVVPLDSDWTNIYTWLVADFMPEARQSMSGIPDVLSTDQERQLRELQYDIRRKQKSRKNKPKEAKMATETAESTTFEGTIVIKATPDGATIMVGKPDCDPHMEPVPSSGLPELLESVPGILETAEDRWASEPLNPKYTKPKATRAKKAPAKAAPTATTEPAAAASEPATGQTPELPLLGGAEPAPSTPVEPTGEGEASVQATESPATETPAEEPGQMAEGGATLLHQAGSDEANKTEEENTVTEETTQATGEPTGEGGLNELSCGSCNFSGFSASALEEHYEVEPDHRPASETPEVEAAEPTAEEPTAEAEGEPDAEQAASSAEQAETPATEEPTAEVEEGSDAEGAAGSAEQAKEPTAEPPTEAPAEQPATSAATGGWVYYLKDTGKEDLDGNGPFYNVGDALTALGSPESERGKYWHRWDRLPKKYQNQIDRRGATEAPAPAAAAESGE